MAGFGEGGESINYRRVERLRARSRCIRGRGRVTSPAYRRPNLIFKNNLSYYDIRVTIIKMT